jgi:hypothetical protein
MYFNRRISLYLFLYVARFTSSDYQLPEWGFGGWGIAENIYQSFVIL